MTKWRNVILTLTIVGMVGSVSASTAAQQANNPTVLDTAIALNQQGDFQGQFDTLIAAVQSADMSVADTLSDPEANVTVFAPTDDAFEQIGITPDNVDQLSQEDLTNILLYHVSEYGEMYQGIVQQDNIETLYGENIMIRNEVLVDQTGDESSFVVANVEASNGVIHAIDSVLKPYELG